MMKKLEKTEIKNYVLKLLKNRNVLEQERKTLLFERTQLERMPESETIESMLYAEGQRERVDSSIISNKTLDIALNYKQKHQALKTQALSEIDLRVRLIDNALRRLEFYVDGLEAYQASILRDYYFEGYTWRDLQDLRGVTYKTLIRHRDNGVKALVTRYHSLEELGLLDL